MVNPTTCAADTLRLWNFLPPNLQQTDANNNYIFLTWLDGIGQQQQILDNLLRDDNKGNPGWSIILDVTRCPTYALPWLAQFVGVRFTGPVVGNDSLMRSAIVSKNGFNRGTVASITAAITPYLSSGGYVNIIERTPDPYSLTVQVHGAIGAMDWAELSKAYPWYTNSGGTPSLTGTFSTYAAFPTSTQGAITAIIQASVPAGIIVSVVFL